MNVGKLKKALEGIPDSTPVTVYADHGQTLMKANYVDRVYVEDPTERCMEPIEEGDQNEDYDYVKVFEIGAG